MSRFLKVIRIILLILSIVLGILLMTTDSKEHSKIPYLIMLIGVFNIFDAIHIYKQNKNN